MHKYFYLLSFLIFSIFSLGFNSNRSNDNDYLLKSNLTATPTPVKSSEAEEISLDKNIVCIPCPPGYRPREGADCDTNMRITVSSAKPENKMLEYEYTISGGRIIGEGAKVIWDMTGAKPGTYQIRIDIEEKLRNEKRSETKIITVEDHICNGDCFCPTVAVNTSASPVKAGETMTFTANISGGSSDVSYFWTVSDGEIIEGQGTPVIKVATTSKMAGKIVKATVEIDGICEDCSKTESATVSIANAKRGKN